MTSTIPKHVLAALLSIFLAISLIPLSPLQAKAEAGIPDAQEIDFATSSIQASEVPDGFVGISNVDDLLAIGDNLDGKFILMADIDLSGYSGPLSIGGSYLSAKGFTGMLEGNGHAIRGLGISIHEPESAQALTGLFGSMRGATVQTSLSKMPPSNLWIIADPATRYATSEFCAVLRKTSLSSTAPLAERYTSRTPATACGHALGGCAAA